MPKYETRVLDCLGQPLLTATSYQASDFAAIRSARRLCDSGEGLEVWREEKCIYSLSPEREPALTWPGKGRALG
jgi:hypothetical protein